jgi:protein gp37
MAKSNIEWTETTWNPTTGCTKISTGCLYCYAETMSKRLKAMGMDKYKEGFKIAVHYNALNEPYKWKKPTVVFVDSMSDLFHNDIPFEFIKSVFEVMNNTPQHTYQVLTKRSERLMQIAPLLNWTSNIWMGVSVENEHVAERITHLVKTPAFIKFISCEPLIGPLYSLQLDLIDWVIVGGESGHKAREIKQDWIDYIHNECQTQNVPFFFKQWGKKHFNVNFNDPTMFKGHKQYAKGGCELNGQIIQEMPRPAYKTKAN